MVRLQIISSQAKQVAPGSANELVNQQRELAVEPVSTVLRYTRPVANNRRHWMRILLMFVSIVLPSLASLVYCLFIATPLYSSEIRFFVGGAAEAGGAAAMAKIIPAGLSGGGSTSLLDGFAVRDYLASYEALDQVQQKVGFFERYRENRLDPFLSMTASATRERRLAFYQSMVQPRYNMTEGIVTITAYAENPNDALLITRELRTLTESFSNEMNKRAVRGSIDFAQEEVSFAEKRLQNATLAIDRWRKVNADLDPENNAKMISELLSSLQMRYLETQAALSQVTSATKDSPQKQFLKVKLDSLQQQINAEQAKLSSTNQEGSVVNRLSEYQSLKVQQEFAAKGYESSLAALQGVRAAAGFKQKYVLTIVEPTLSETPNFPRPVLTTFIVFCLGLVAYGLLSLVTSVIAESRGV